jgi:hypothetical protein
MVDGACYFIEEPPEVDYRGGLFYATYKIGDGSFTVCFRPSTMFAGIAAAAFKARSHRFEGAEIIKFPDKALEA